MRFTNRQILKITFPVLLSLMMEQLIGLTDTIYLGHVGEVELGASAIAGIFYLTIFMVGFGFSIGAQVLIARRNGEGNLAGIGPIFMQGMWFLLGMAVLFFGVSRALAPWLLGHLIESRAICAAAESYLGYRTFGFFFSFAAAMFRAFYVGTTNTRILTANSVVMVLTNVVLNYLLIFGGWGDSAARNRRRGHRFGHFGGRVARLFRRLYLSSCRVADLRPVPVQGNRVEDSPAGVRGFGLDHVAGGDRLYQLVHLFRGDRKPGRAAARRYEYGA